MRVKIGLNGELELRDENGVVSRIGPEHPDYHLHLRSMRIDPKKARIGGIVCILVGLGLLWLNWHLLITSGYYYLKLVVIGTPILFMGLAALVLPKHVGAARGEPYTRSRKVVQIALVVFMIAASGLNWYLLANHQP